MKIIDGKKIAEKIKQDLKKKVSQLPSKPGLAIILVGDDFSSHIYVRLKEQAASQIGIYFEKYFYPDDTDEKIVINKINELNDKENINGILVQLPLPEKFDSHKIISHISPKKDVDGFHEDNIKALLSGQPHLIPGLAIGIMELIKSTNALHAGKNALIISNSKIFAQPLKYYLKQDKISTESCYPESSDCTRLSRNADIIIVAIGRPRFIKRNMIKKNSIVIDVGYNRLDGKTVGDVDFDSVKGKAGWITPVPGGVGPMTVALLLSNVIKAYAIQRGP